MRFFFVLNNCSYYIKKYLDKLNYNIPELIICKKNELKLIETEIVEIKKTNIIDYNFNIVIFIII